MKAFQMSQSDAMTNDIFNQLPQWAHTCSHTLALTCLLQERHTLNFIKEDLRYKLASISEKLYRLNTPFTQLTPEEQKLWNSFDISDIMFFLSGQRERVPDYSNYLPISTSNGLLCNKRDHNPLSNQAITQTCRRSWPNYRLSRQVLLFCPIHWSIRFLVWLVFAICSSIRFPVRLVSDICHSNSQLERLNTSPDL